MHLTDEIPFGILLKQLRKRAGMTQRDLAAALDYSDSLISSLEKGHRQPDLEVVIARCIPALGLQDDPTTATLLIERAAAARGERAPISAIASPLSSLVHQEQPSRHQEQLPVPPTELIGRTAEVDLICYRLLGHSGRLLTLVGPPGIGKTRLALAVATRLQYNYADGTFFVTLAEIQESALMASSILVTLGMSNASRELPILNLIESLRRKTMLLVLDNCEQIQGAAPLVAEVLAACPGITLLVTSRERLHLRAEQRYRVLPLELAFAVELFTQRAQAVNANFDLTAKNLPTIETICQRLDRLPLALELCAAQTDLLSPALLLAQLHDHRLDLLVDGAHDLPPQQRTLRHAIHNSYSLLSKAEGRLFRSLGVFVGGFDLPALEAVATQQKDGITRDEDSPGVLTMLHALVGKSLVQAETMPSGELRFFLIGEYPRICHRTVAGARRGRNSASTSLYRLSATFAQR